MGLAHQHGDSGARWFARDCRAALLDDRKSNTQPVDLADSADDNRRSHPSAPQTTARREGCSMEEWSPLEEDVLLKGSLLVIVRDREGRPRPDKRVIVKGCGFV